MLSTASLLFLTHALPLLPSDPVFRDVTRELGVEYLHSASPLPAIEVFHIAGGAAVGDYDADGWPDLFVTRLDDTDILFRNLGAPPSGAHLGFLDVSESVFVGMQSEPSNGACWADIDEDGDLDLYVSSIRSLRYRLYANDGEGHLVEDAAARGADMEDPFIHNGMGITFGDYDLDGYLDFYVCEWQNPQVQITTSHSRLYHNQGVRSPGHFHDVTEAAGVSIDDLESPVFIGPGVWAFTPRFADMDDDGLPDLVLTSDFLTSRIFWNEGGGRFTDGTRAAGLGTDENGMGAAIGDVDLDGRLDLFVTAISDVEPTEGNWGTSGNRLYRNEGGRLFSDRTEQAGVRDGYWGWGTSLFDADNDGDLDLIMTTGFSPAPNQEFLLDPMRYWRNETIGLGTLSRTTFTEQTRSVGIVERRSGKGLVTFDFDRDGDLDVFVVHNGDGPALLRNDGGNRSAWLRIDLRGDTSNTFGIGARIELRVTLESRPLVREVHAGSTFVSQDERIAHFGLGKGTSKIEQIVVRWPSGVRQELRDVEANQLLLVHEPPLQSRRK